MNIAGFPMIDETLERIPHDSVLDPQREARASNILNAVAITAMEGGRPSEFCRDLLSRYERGEISAAEMRERMHRHIKS